MLCPSMLPIHNGETGCMQFTLPFEIVKNCRYIAVTDPKKLKSPGQMLPGLPYSGGRKCPFINPSSAPWSNSSPTALRISWFCPLQCPSHHFRGHVWKKYWKIRPFWWPVSYPWKVRIGMSIFCTWTMGRIVAKRTQCRPHDQPQFFILPWIYALCHVTLRFSKSRVCFPTPGLDHVVCFGQQDVRWVTGGACALCLVQWWLCLDHDKNMPRLACWTQEEDES